MPYTTILIQPSTRLLLKKIGRKDETYDKIILDLLKYYHTNVHNSKEKVEIKTTGSKL